MTRSILAVTPGDTDGIGPEIVWKAIQSNAFSGMGVDLLCVGARAPFDTLGALIEEWSPHHALIPPTHPKPFIWLLPAPVSTPDPKKFLPGYQAGWSIEKATELVLKN